MGKFKEYFEKRKKRREEIAAAREEAKKQGEYIPSTSEKFFGWFQNKFGTIKKVSGVIENVSDVYTSIKDNKQHINRRLTMIFIFISLISAVITSVNFLTSGVLARTALGWSIAVYTITALYFPVIIMLLVAETVYRKNITLKTTEKYNAFLKVMRYVIRIVAFVFSVLSLIVSAMIGDVSGKSLVVDILSRVFSIITIICSLLPSATGLIKNIALWLISPVKGKVSFGWVAGLWKESVDVLAASKSREASGNFTAAEKVKLDVARRFKVFKKIKPEKAQSLYDIIDEYAVMGFRGKYIINIKENDVYNVIEEAPEQSRVDLFEQVDSIFEYAVERKIIEENPCVGLRDCYSLAKKSNAESAVKEGGFLGRIFGKKQ